MPTRFITAPSFVAHSFAAPPPVCFLFTAGLLLLGPLAAPALAQDDEGTAEAAAETSPWTSTAELSLVSTAGNAESTSFGFAASVKYAFEDSLLRWRASGVRAENTTTMLRAVGTPADFRLVETELTETTAENYETDLRYERGFASGRSAYANIGWRQDEFAGFDSRLIVGAGLVFPLRDVDGSTWDFETGVTWTREEDLDGEIDEFAGVRLALEGEQQLTETTLFEMLLEVDGNVEETSDVRSDLYLGVKVAMSEILSLKVSLDLRYDNLPATVSIPLETEAGAPTGDTVAVELDELDSELKASLVFAF